MSQMFLSQRQKSKPKLHQSWNFKSQRKSKKYKKKCPSNMVYLEDSSALGLPVSATVCQISSKSKFRFLRRCWLAAMRKSLQAKHCDLVRCNERGIFSLPPPSAYLKGEFSINIASCGATLDTGLWSSFGITCCTASILCWARGKQKILYRISKISSETVRWSLVTG